MRYFDVRTNTQGRHRVELNPDRAVYVERRLLAIEALDAEDVAAFADLFLQDTDAAPTDADDSLGKFAMWERIEQGLPEVY